MAIFFAIFSLEAGIIFKEKSSTILGNESTFLGRKKTFFGKIDNLFRKVILRKRTFGWLGVDALFSRSSVGKIREGIREVKETAILRIVLFNNYNNRIPMWRCDWILFLP